LKKRYILYYNKYVFVYPHNLMNLYKKRLTHSTLQEGKMERTGLLVKYRIEDELFESNQLENEHYSVEISESDFSIKVKILPKTELYMEDFRIEYKKEYEEGERFFANGFQSWTTSREYIATDKSTAYPSIVDYIEPLADICIGCSDGRIHKNHKLPGQFHSFTYTYLRKGNNLEFFGSLTERQGFTLFDVDFGAGKFVISKDIEGAIITEPYEVFDIYLTKGNYDEVFDKYFAKMQIKKPRIDRMTGYTSWYNYFTQISHDIILRDLDGLDRAKEKVSIFQIDDGYERCVGDWLDTNERFPNKMGYYAKKIHDKGYKAGIWLAPFNAVKESKTYQKHKDWVIRKEWNGKKFYGTPNWGGAYTFDIYNEEFRAHLKHVLDVVCNVYGYDMVKLDFLYSQCIFPRNGKARGTIMCEAMDFLRECVGDKIILGCGVPLGPAFGVVDACRISCDIALNYNTILDVVKINNEVPSARNAMTSTIFRRHLNGRAFVNDPDVFFLRDFNLKYTEEQKHILVTINNMFGDVLFVSDDAAQYKTPELRSLKQAFGKRKYKIVSAEFVSDKVIRIVYNTSTTANKVLEFDIKEGKVIEGKSDLI